MKHLKNTTSIIAVAAVAGFVAFASSGANAASTNGTASATLLAPITISPVTALQFGTMSNGVNTVTVTTAGARSATDAGQLAGGTVTAANFSVSGNLSATYTITLPADSTVTITNGTDTLSVDGFNHDAGATPTLSGTGTGSFNVGAALSLVGGETAGNYTGTFPVTVNY